MKRIGASYSLTKLEIESRKDYLDTSSFKDMLHKSLTHSLSNAIMGEVKLPIPEFRNDRYIYEMRVCICDEKEYIQILQKKRELEAYKKLYSGSEDIIKRYLLEQEIELLQGK